MKSIAIFGGTFDPVHTGHMQISLAIQTFFNFDSYYFLPCKTPIIKPPNLASSQQRVEMLRLAIKDYPQFQLDLREINRDSPSYMVKTLSSFRTENKHESITLIMGYDAFLSLSNWHQWKKIIKLANLLVISRDHCPSSPVLEPVKELLLKHRTEIQTELLRSEAGKIVLFNAGNYDISSTHIREALKNHCSVEGLLPEKVLQYIKQSRLYQ